MSQRVLLHAEPTSPVRGQDGKIMMSDNSSEG